MLHKSLLCSSLFEGAMSSNGRLVGSPSRRNAEQFPEARLVRITRRGAAIGVNPVGMLDPQIVVNLLLELGVGVDLVRHGNWLGWNDHLYSPPLSLLSPRPVGSVQRSTVTRLYEYGPICDGSCSA